MDRDLEEERTMTGDLEERTMIGGQGFRREDNDRWTGI